MFCSKCGFNLSEEMEFCPQCGQPAIKDTAKDTMITEAVQEDSAEAAQSDVQEESVEAAQDDVQAEPVDDAQKESEEAEQTTVPAVVSNEVQALEVVSDDENKKFCHNCGAENAAGDDFCYSCGAPFGIVKGKGARRAVNKKVCIALGAVAAVVLVVFAGTILLKNIGGKAPLVYLKDNALVKMQGKKQFEITGDAYDDDDLITGPYSRLSWMFQLSADEKYMYYPEDYDGEVFDLYRKKTASKKDDGVEMASGIVEYSVLESGSIIYIKDSYENKMYLADAKESVKIDSDVEWYSLSEGEKYLLWKTVDPEDSSDTTLYIADIKHLDEKVKVDSDVDSVTYMSDDFKKIIYTKQDGDELELYIYRDLAEKEKIVSDYNELFVCEDADGNADIYYTVTSEEDTLTASDFIEDDYAAEDAKMQEPNIEDYQTVTQKPSYWGTRETVETDEAYYDALDKYDEKLMRDYYRESLEYMEFGDSSEEVYYYDMDKNEETKVKDSSVIWLYTYYGSECMICGEVDFETMEKPKLSQLLAASSETNIEDEISEKILDAWTYSLIYKGKEVELAGDMEGIDEEDMYSENVVEEIFCDEKNKKCYFTAPSDDGKGLYVTNYGSMDGKVSLYKDEVFDVSFITDDGIYYTMDQDDEVCDLYLNDEKLDSDVKTYSTRKDDNTVYYIVDPDDGEGTLKRTIGGKSVKIADDVAEYSSDESGDVVFLSDYNFKKYRGDLSLFSNNKIEKIDTDVTSIVYFK